MIPLDNNEKILWQGTPSPRVLATWFFSKMGGFLLIIAVFFFAFSPLLFSKRYNFFPFIVAIGGLLLFLAVLAFIYILLLRKTYEYCITSNRIIFKGGILLKTQRSVPFHKVTDIETSQHVLEQVLGISKLNIFTAGTGSMRAEIIFSGLKDTSEPERILKDIIKTYKSTGE
jgi:putative membrane protein